ncbi:Uncharacterised protein [Mycobacteroides abscessus subsp. abscessus]|nr:Uncharacterised protein [Mycobacteroides abscessus subsp. abscessus]
MVEVLAEDQRKGKGWRLELAAVPRVADSIRIEGKDAEVKSVVWMPQPYEFAAVVQVSLPVKGRML